MVAKSFKALLVLGLFLLISSQSFGQVMKFQTVEASQSLALSDGSWGEWSEGVAVKQAVVVDFDKGYITVASTPKQKYDIQEAEEKYKDEDGDEFFPFICEDDEGDLCRVLLTVLHSEGGKTMMSIEYDDVVLLYSLSYVE